MPVPALFMIFQVLICALASCLGMLCSSDQLGAMMVFQGGISMQTLPAFGLGPLGRQTGGTSGEALSRNGFCWSDHP